MEDDQRERRDRLSPEQLARSAAVDLALVEELARLRIIAPDEHGYRPTDAYRVRFGVLLVEAGIDLADAARAIDAGVVSFGDLDVLFPEPVFTTDITHRDLATDLGVDLELLMAVRLAAGFATRAPDDSVRSDEASILRDVVTLASAFGVVADAPTIARMYGDRVERIASAAFGLYRERVDRPWLESGRPLDPEISRRGTEVGRRLLDQTETLLVGLYRRAMDDGLLAGWIETTEALMAHHGYLPNRPRAQPGIAFVDVSGYTRLTAEEGDEYGSMIATRLLEESERVAAARGIRIVKLLGDGVMLHAHDPGRLMIGVPALVKALGEGVALPAHAGIHAGHLIERDGDFFGHTVNVASRIAGVAGPGEVLASAAAAGYAPPSIRLTELSSQPLRGVPEPVPLVRVEGT